MSESDPDCEVPDLYPHVMNRADYDPDFDPDAPITCERCGAIMHYTGSCKIVCDNCGYVRDCSDP